MKLSKLFTEHPRSVGESYFEHLRAAGSFSVALLGAALCCAVHALLPFLFEKTGSSMIERLHDRMCVNRARLSEAAANQADIAERPAA
ncbi:MAG: DUF6356 family protein [Pseudomonadota bacterium]